MTSINYAVELMPLRVCAVPRLFLIVVLMSLFVVASCSKEAPESLLPKAKGKNVLFITFDALRADVLEHENNLMPELRKFAEKSVWFENGYTVGQATPSSFAAAFTGRYPIEVLRGWRLEETQTLAKVFEAAGYQTAGFFNNIQLTRKRRYNQGFQYYDATVDQQDQKPLDHITEFFTENRDPDKPFMAWVHFVNPHSPYQIREEGKDLYSEDYEGPYKESSGARVQTYDLDEITGAGLTRIKELYQGEVRFADGRFADVMKLVEEQGLLEDTIIIISADHGEMLGENGYIGHAWLNEGVIRIPYIIHHPQGKPARISEVVTNMDFLPTLAGMLDLPAVTSVLDGADLSKGIPDDRPFIFTQMTNDGWLAMSARAGDDKLIVGCGPRWRNFDEFLYDLGDDPTEQQNIIEQHPEKRARLFEIMSTTFSQDPCITIEDAIAGTELQDTVEDENIEQLRALGYIQ